VETILPTRVLDTFSLPRDDYLAIDEKFATVRYSCSSGFGPPRRGWFEQLFSRAKS
jgi:hypothetical protein